MEPTSAQDTTTIEAVSDSSEPLLTDAPIVEDKKEESPKEDPILSIKSEAEEAAPAFTPDFKFRVGKEELEIADWARPLIKDDASNKQIKDFFERAEGIHLVKDHRDKLQGTVGDLQGQITGFNTHLETLREHVQNGHFEDFFDALKIPEQEIIKWAANRVNYYEMDPAQRSQIDQQRDVRNQNMNLNQENVQYQNEHQQALTDLREGQLQMAMSMPDVAPLVAEFDKTRGEGAFRNEIINRGLVHHTTTGRDVLPNEIIKELIPLFGLNSASVGGQGGNLVNPTSATAIAPEAKPVFPHVKGTGASPMRRAPKSINDLRALAKNVSQ